MNRSDAKLLHKITENHVPGVLGVPSLARDRDVQPCPLKKTGRLTTQDISKALPLEGEIALSKTGRCVIFVKGSTHFLLRAQFGGTFPRIDRRRIDCYLSVSPT
jgi:hypothetical protein